MSHTKSKIRIKEVVQTDFLDHPAVKAWEKTQPEFVEPKYIEVLTQKKKGSVYRLAGVGPQKSAVIAKRCKSEKAGIERIIYEEVFPSLIVPTPNFYGYSREQDGIFWWLFLEDVGNQPLSSIIAQHRTLAAQWLGEMNSSVEITNLSSHLPNRGPEYYQRYISLVLEMVPKIKINYSLVEDYQDLFKSILSMCNYLGEHWNQIENFCNIFPRTIVHGDCQVKNVHVRLRHNAWEVLPFDWASAGWGLPATDLGQLGLPYKKTPPTIPDHKTYLEVVRERWSSFDLETVENLANLGQLFWSLKVISISLPEFNDREAYLEGLLHNYGVYASVLNSAIRAADWIN